MAIPTVHGASREALAKATIRGFNLENAQGAGVSTDPDDAADRWTPAEAIRPPLDLELLANLTQIAPLRRSCIAAITLNTVGLGFTLEPIEGAEQDASDDERLELERRLDELARRDERLGRPSFTRLLSAAQWDRQEVGQGAIEVSRNRVTGEIDGLYHKPGKRVRRRADRRGWIIGASDGTSVQHFYNFGEKVEYDADGRPQAKLRTGDGTFPSSPRWDRNELIVFRLYTSASRDYGLPPDAQLANDYLGDKLAAGANVAYFTAGGVPPSVVFVQGKEAEDGKGGIEVELDQSVIESILNTMSSAGNFARVAVIPLPPGVEANKVDLGKLSERDIGFVNYRTDNRRRSLGSWRLSPIFVADIEDTNYSTAAIERKLTKEQVFTPEQSELADVLNMSLVAELAAGIYRLRFAELDTTADEDRRASADALADRGKITNGEYRDAHGYPPLPEAAKGAEPDLERGEVPFGWHSELVKSRALSLNPLDPRKTQRLPIEDDDPEALAKAARARREDELAENIDDVFEQVVGDAVRTVSIMADDAELHPVVIEKAEGGQVLIRPFEPNGAGG